LQEIRSNDAYKALPVIMLTTEGQDKDKDKAISLGATAYIVKPFKPTKLLSLIEKILPSS